MTSFPSAVSWDDMALRFLSTIVAGALIGFNRDENGHPGGLRTTILVALAAAVAMIQANLLLATQGKSSSSFATMDVMRLPLGILSGIGFLGAGAIMRRDDRVTGLTTAATLWFTTVIGLCFGGGQIILGIASTAVCLCVLWGLKLLEGCMLQDRRSVLVLSADKGLPLPRVFELLEAGGLRIAGQAQQYKDGNASEVRLDLRWRAGKGAVAPPRVIGTISELPGVVAVRWTPKGM